MTIKFNKLAKKIRFRDKIKSRKRTTQINIKIKLLSKNSIAY